MKKLSFILILTGLLSAVSFAQKMSSESMALKTVPVVGQTPPDFSLVSSTGETVTLSKLGGPAILVFYRGYWCPYCARQLAELRSLLNGKDKARLFAISIDTAEKSRELATKIAKDGKGDVTFTLLSDPGYKTIASYGLIDPAYEGKGIYGIPRPAVFILDKKGKVTWSRVESDYKFRPSNEEIREELDKLK